MLREVHVFLHSHGLERSIDVVLLLPYLDTSLVATLEDDDEERYKSQFGQYIDSGIEGRFYAFLNRASICANILAEEVYENAHAKIREDPNAAYVGIGDQEVVVSPCFTFFARSYKKRNIIGLIMSG